MHQTFYIDADEEISSVIDRLNKSMSIDNYYVVPKRALFLQSIVNLKILKREADKISKNVIIVTQDEVGCAMAERAGIEVRPTLDGLDTVIPDIVTYQDESAFEDANEEEPESSFSTQKTSYPQQDKQIRLSNVGSGDYFQQGSDDIDQLQGVAANLHRAASSSVAASNISARTAAGGKNTKPQTVVLKNINEPEVSRYAQATAAPYPQPSRPTSIGNGAGASIYKKQLDPHKMQSVEKMFSGGRPQSQLASSMQDPETKQIGKGRLKKFFVVFMILCLLVFLGVAAYLFVPSAKITIVPNITLQKANLDISAATATTVVSQTNIPLRVFSQDEQVSLSYDVASQTTVSGNKATGTVVIYNQFSSDPQTLIATTRLQSADGKIFHIVKSVTVPGSSTVGGQMAPGTIQADIVADQAGSDYNIDPGKFSIPGFDGGPKADKFYAQSTVAMAGGTTVGQPAVGTTVSQSDLDSAKQKTEAAFKDKVNSLVNGQLASGEIALPQAENVTITTSSSLAKVGTKTGSFDWVVNGSVQALIFSENDVKTVINSQQQGSQQDAGVQQSITKIDYGSATPDFDTPSLALNVYAETTLTPKIDSDQIKKDLLGKSDDQLSDILKNYTSIKSANVEFDPTFITHIPLYPFRVTVQIQNNTQ